MTIFSKYGRIFSKLFFSFFAICFLSSAISCKKKEAAPESSAGNVIEIAENTHNWYSFSSTGFEKTSMPQNAPAMPEKPWTESVRICGSGSASDENNQQIPVSFALVNRLGILTFTPDGPALHTDVNIFSTNTASNLFVESNSPVFSIYKSSFFNDLKVENESKTEHPFLIRYDTMSGIFFPLITYENLQLETNEQITDFSWNGKQLNCSVKTSQNSRSDFSYFTVMPSVPLVSISPKTAPSTIFVGESTAESFRNSKQLLEFSAAPERLKKLLSTLPKDIPMLIECSFTGNSSTKTYRQSINNDDSALSAKAQIGDTWILTIFEDGTSYFAGACHSRPVLENGKPVAFRLPKLPEGFVYSYFSLAGTQLYAAWEETSFFKTGRSGFLSVNLDAVLYNKLRRSQIESK